MQAIVLKRRDVREFDQVITLYTREAGKREVLARGIKKSTSKNAAALLPFFLLEVEIVPGKDVLHLTKVQIVESFSALSGDLEKLKLLTVSLGILNQAIRGEERDLKIFNGLAEWLRFLNAESSIATGILDAFFLKMWAYLGLKIELDRCVGCGSKEAVSMDIKNGGVLCRACTIKREVFDPGIQPITAEELNLLKLLLTKKLGDVNELLRNVILGRLHGTIYAFIQFHSHQLVADWNKLV